MAWGPECTIGDVATLKGFECVFRNLLQVAASFAILVVFVMLIVGGIKYMTSGGDPKATESAKNTLTYAILGLVFLILAWLILKFIYIFTGVDVTQFKIGG